MKNINIGKYTVDSFYVLAIAACVVLFFCVEDSRTAIAVVAMLIAGIAAVDASWQKQQDEGDSHDR